jgi:uncharacterized protein YjbJ (UPF0337 family)
MDQERIKGTIDMIMGAVKYALGGASGDSKMKAEGKADQEKGEDRKAVGESNDAANDATTEAVK